MTRSQTIQTDYKAKIVHEALEYSLDYVQVRNRLLLSSSSLTDMHAFYQFIHRQVQIVERPGESYEGVGRKKKVLHGQLCGRWSAPLFFFCLYMGLYMRGWGFGLVLVSPGLSCLVPSSLF